MVAIDTEGKLIDRPLRIAQGSGIRLLAIVIERRRALLAGQRQMHPIGASHAEGHAPGVDAVVSGGLAIHVDL